MSFQFTLITMAFIIILVLLLKSLHFMTNLKRNNANLNSSLSTFIDVYNNNEGLIKKLELNTLLFEKNSEAILILGSDGVIHQANPSFEDLYGSSERYLISKPFSEIFSECPPVNDLLLSSDKSIRLNGRDISGSLFPVELSITPIYVGSELENIVVSMRDCTEQIEKESQLKKQVITDKLTNLYNRKGIETFIDSAIEDGLNFSLLFIDLNKFKPVNDTYGHDVGDLYLIDIAHRIYNGVGDSGVVGRYGGDEFVCLIYQETKFEIISETIERINLLFDSGYSHGEDVIPIGASFGFSSTEMHGLDRDGLIKIADQAMYKSKESRDGSLRTIPICENNKGNELDISDYNLTPVAMPIYNESQQIEYYEIYLRTSKGKILDVINLFDEVSGMNAIYKETLRNISESARAISLIRHGIKFSLKLERSSLVTLDFYKEFLEMINEFGLPPECIAVRVDEKHLEEDFNTAIGNINQLELLGVRVCLDDFCLGKLSIIDRLSIGASMVKLPKEVVYDIYNNPSKMHMLNSVFGLVSAMQSSVVVEGIKTEEMFELFVDHGVDYVLGEYFGSPVDIESLSEPL